MQKEKMTGRVIWITGMSGAGKTTVARCLYERLSGAVLLDGDELRAALGADSCSYDVEGRKKLAMSYARLAGLLAGQGLTVIVATISLFHEVHSYNRQHLPGYLEVFLDVPEAVRRSRDPKGLYAAETAGSKNPLVGGGARAELPLSPDIRLDDSCPAEEAAALILGRLEDDGACAGHVC